MSDDDDRIHQSCIDEAKQLGVELICFSEWEAVELELENDFEKYDAIILDGKGKLNADSSGGDARHAAKSVGWLKEQRGRGKYVPTVIYTAYLENFELFDRDDLVLRLFDKHSDKGFEEVLSFLLSEVVNNPINKFKSAQPDVVSFSNKLFSIENRHILLRIYTDINAAKKDFLWKKNVLDGLRRLNEALVDIIPLQYYSPPFELRDFIEKMKREGHPKATMGNRSSSIIDYFHNNKMVVPGPVLNTIRNIYYTASTYAAHSDEQREYYPSTEMILGLIYSHFGCYHWFNSIIKD